MGQRGPKPGSGGRPKKPLAEKITDFLSAKQKDGTELCAALVSPQKEEGRRRFRNEK